MKEPRVLEFSSAQWESLAILYIVGEPIPQDLFSNLAPLSKDPLLELINEAEASGWIRRIPPDNISLTPDLPMLARHRIRDIGTHQKQSWIRRIEKKQLKSAVGPACMARLLFASGRVEEAVTLWICLFEQAIRDKDDKRSVLFLEETMKGLFTLGDSEKENAKRQFLHSVLNLLENADYFIPTQMAGPTWHRLVKKAHNVARGLGDRRSQALLYLGYGYFLSHRQPSEAIPMFVQGKKAIEDLGDPDIMAAAAVWIGMYYCIQGRYKDAVEYMERFQSDPAFHNWDDQNYNICHVAGSNAFFNGRFHLSIGIFLSQWRTARIMGRKLEAVMLHAMLGTFLTALGYTPAGYRHLSEALSESIALDSEMAVMLSRLGLALYHMTEDRIEDAYKQFKSAFGDAKIFTVMQRFNTPWPLELMHAFQKKGFDPVPGWLFSDHYERCINGPNLHLRGVALRINAEEKIRQGEGHDRILPDLHESEACLKKSGDPTELTKTIIAQIRLKLRDDDMKGATVLARSIWNKGPDFRSALPRKLIDFLYEQVNMYPEKHRAGEDIIGKFIRLLDAFHPPLEPNEEFSVMVRLSNRLLGAERGALFIFNSNQRSPTPELNASCNLTEAEAAHPDFRVILEKIIESFRENRPLVIQTEQTSTWPVDAQVRSLVCLPINIGTAMKGVLFHSNAYLDDHFANLDNDTLKTYCRYLGEFLKFITIHRDAPSISSIALSTPHLDTKNEILTRNSGMLEIIEQTKTAARSDSTVMILGETGTGKELFARKIHTESPRSKGPFVIVDATAIPENLLESELFGHEKGAFTGADRMKKGQIETADNGTLFVDEIGELPLSTQAKLLRAFETKTFRRLGGTRQRHSNFRLVVATNRDLSEEVAAGRFRQDLFYRLNVITIHIPPLRRRGKDIILLANHFLRKYTSRYRKSNLQVTPRDEAKLTVYTWPGNVRELKNVMERAAILSMDDHLDLNIAASRDLPEAASGDEILPMNEMQRLHIERALEITDGIVSGPNGAAKLLGMKSTTLFSRMQKLGIR